MYPASTTIRSSGIPSATDMCCRSANGALLVVTTRTVSPSSQTSVARGSMYAWCVRGTLKLCSYTLCDARKPASTSPCT